MHSIRLAPLALVLLSLAACKPEPEAAPVVAPEPAPVVEAPTSAPLPMDHVFQCEDLTVTATYGDVDGPAGLVIGDRMLSLNRTDAPSGLEFSDGAGNNFVLQGDSGATLMLAGEKQRTCTIAADAATPAIDPSLPPGTVPPTDSTEPTEAGEPSTPPAG